MSWWPWRRSKKAKELEEAKERILQLERDYRSLALTLQNLQSAIVAISRNNDLVANDVRNIQDMVSHFLQDIDPTSMILGLSSSPSRDDN